jgi:hypothetical protein
VLIAAAVCPHPPLLVPEVAGEAAPELDALRAACDAAVGPRLQNSGGRAADLLVVVGGDETTRAYGAAAAGSLRPYGLDLTVGRGEPILPLSLTIGGWLVGRAVAAAGPGRPGRPPVRFQGVAEQAAPSACLRLGRELAAAADRVVLLAMGDGSACRAEKATDDDLDERAEPYDAAIARALRHADAGALAGLDPELSSELRVAGRAAWQVLAGAAGVDAFTGAVLADVAPYGVGYFVASWVRGRLGPKVAR